MQVAQDAGGGGSVRKSPIGGGKVYPNALPIDDVLNNTVPFSLQIKEAPELNGSTDSSIVQQASHTVTQEASETSGLAESILARLESTNSKQYYTGEDAQAQVAKLKEIIDDVNGLADALNNFAKFPFAATTTQYNKALKTLKDCVDLKLLKELAIEINDAAKSASPWRGGINKHNARRLYSISDNINSYPGDGAKIKNNTRMASKKYVDTRTRTDSHGQQQTEYIYDYAEWTYIDCFGIIDWQFWPFTIMDDDLPKIVKKFNDAGINPYQYINR